MLVNHYSQVARQLLMARDRPVTLTCGHRFIQALQVKLAEIGTVRQIIALLHQWMHLSEHTYRTEGLDALVAHVQDFQQRAASRMESGMLRRRETVARDRERAQ